MFFDSHSHINFSEFKDDGDIVIRRSLDNNVQLMIVGTDYKSSNLALYYANRFEKGVYAAVGLHPNNLISQNKEKEGLDKESESKENLERSEKYIDYKYEKPAEEFNYDTYEKLASFEKVLAIGETGLDYYRIKTGKGSGAAKKLQQKVFLQHLQLSRNLDLPVIIHCRQAHDDVLEILKDFRKTYLDFIPTNRPWGVMHCFSGDEDLAWQYFSLGLIISFTGLISFSKQWDDLIRKIPIDKFMIETDSPYMAPEPYRGQRNEPLLVQYVAGKIAEIKNTSIEKIAIATSNTAKNIFQI